MPVVGDFVVVETGQRNISSSPYSKKFNTGGRRTQEGAYVSLMVKGLAGPNTSEPTVHINSRFIGNLSKAVIGGEEEWQTQMLAFNGSVLNGGDNTILISTAPRGSSTENFEIKSLICHFHQSA